MTKRLYLFGLNKRLVTLHIYYHQIIGIDRRMIGKPFFHSFEASVGSATMIRARHDGGRNGMEDTQVVGSNDHIIKRLECLLIDMLNNRFIA